MPQKQQQTTIFPPPEIMPRNLQTQASVNTCSQKLTTKISSSSSSTPTSTTTYSSSSSACAACKYQRKKCSSDCLLAPYFPPTHQTEFLNTHKLFGVSNISKIIKSIDNPAEKETAIRSMIYQAEARARDPIGGCAHLIRDLQLRIARCRAELDFVLNQIDMYRAAQAQSIVDVNVNVVPPPSDNEEDGGIINNQNILEGYNHQNLLLQDIRQQRHQYNVIPENQVVIQDYDYVEVDDLNQMWSMESLASQNDGLINMIESKHAAPSSISVSSPVMDDLNQQQQSSIEDPDVQ